MAYKKNKPRIRKSDAITSEFSRVFEERVARRMRPDKADLVRKTFDYEYINSLSQVELSDLAKNLAKMANQRIGIYKNTKYYRETKLSEPKPTPAAYRILEENKGDIEKFNINSYNDMKLSSLRREVSILGHFLSSESSYASGQERIMQERYKSMTDAIKKALPSDKSKQFDNIWKEEIYSDTFQRKFWEIYNKVTERVGGKGSWYERDKFMSNITRILTIEPLYGLSLDEMVDYVRNQVSKTYEEAERNQTLPEDSLRRSLRTGSNK